MKIRKKTMSLLLVGVAMILSGCGGGGNSSQSSSSSISSSEGSSSSSSVAADIVNADLPLGQTTYKDTAQREKQLNRDSIYRNSGNPHVASYHGADKPQRLFVAPFAFEKDTSDPLDNITADDALLEKVRIAFSGSEEETKRVGGYISVQDFYNKSSFGKGGFEVIVMPTWIKYPGTPSEYRSASGGQGGVFAAEYARKWYMSEYAKTGHGDLGAEAEPLSYFDSDGDGFIDLMWNIYAYPQATNDTSFWWAYVTYTMNGAGSAASPNVKTLAWASTAFMNLYKGYDSHTFIHETGHTFGLDDYYDYNKTWAPMAGVDYMDHNLGDHNAYSKFSLGWINPMVLKEEDLAGGKTAVITLRQGSLSGDALVLASPGYNGTAFDEYLILELMGPYGLSKTDYESGYEGTTGFTKPGVRVLHVDARVEGNNHDAYLKTADEIGQGGTDVRIDNSYGGRSGLRADGDYFPIVAANGKVTKSYMSHLSTIESMVPADGSWLKNSGYNATNDSLFTTTDRFTLKGANNAWAKTYMPSQSSLWNKAKTTTGWKSGEQTYEIDDTVTCNYSLKVLSVETDAEWGTVAKIQITL